MRARNGTCLGAEQAASKQSRQVGDVAGRARQYDSVTVLAAGAGQRGRDEAPAGAADAATRTGTAPARAVLAAATSDAPLLGSAALAGAARALDDFRPSPLLWATPRRGLLGEGNNECFADASCALLLPRVAAALSSATSDPCCSTLVRKPPPLGP